MANMMKDLGRESGIRINGGTATGRLSWKTTSGGQKGLSGLANKMKEIDLDVQAVIYQNGDPKDLCYHGNKDPLNNGSITIGKDAGGSKFKLRVGKKADAPSVEEISLNLDRIPPWVTSIVLLASAFEEGVKITDAESVELVIVADGVEIYFKPTITDGGNTCLMAKLTRDDDGSGWTVDPVNLMVTAHSKNAMLNVASAA